VAAAQLHRGVLRHRAAVHLGGGGLWLFRLVDGFVGPVF
jgi:hypothetical protein